MPAKKTHNVPFQMVINALLDESKMFPPTYLRRFSDISKEELEQVEKIWPQVNPARRVALLEDLEELNDSDLTVSFKDFNRFALNDSEPGVRVIAVRMLWEEPENALAQKFTQMMDDDPDATVRSAAASALGMFVYLGELEEIPQPLHQQVVDDLLRVTSGPDTTLVRRRALESLGFSGREEVPPLIQAGFDSGDLEWMTSALFAMGRSADPRWEQAVLSMLDHDEQRIQAEAARAAGQLELAAAREILIDLVGQYPDLDEDVYANSIWSLSQIGGDEVGAVLENALEQTEDEDLADFIESALENLEFTEEFEVLDMFDFGAPDEDEDEEDGANPRLN